jgi:hypothetical protein
VLDASNGKPGLGQPVDFSARIVNASGGPRAKVDGARFRISGPSLAAGTELAAQDDGSGVFRTTFTFFEAGRFEVTFSAHADGASVRSTRLVVVGEPKALPPVPTSGAEPGPTPAPSAKWL